MNMFKFTQLMHSLYGYVGHGIFIITKYMIEPEEQDDIYILLEMVRVLNIENDPTFNDKLQYSIRKIIRYIEVFCKKCSISNDDIKEYLKYICPVIHREQLVDMAMLILKHVYSPMRPKVLEHLIPFCWKEAYFRVELYQAISTEGEIVRWLVYDMLGIHPDIKKMYLEIIQSKKIPLEWVHKKELPIRTYIDERRISHELTIKQMKHSIQHWSLTHNTLMKATQYFDDYIPMPDFMLEPDDLLEDELKLIGII